MEVTNKEVAAVLRKARARVKKGWCKGSFEDAEGRCCAAGAINRAAPYLGSPIKDIAIETLTYTVGLGLYPDEYGLTSFNDAPETTKEDVLAAFDAALVLVEG